MANNWTHHHQKSNWTEMEDFINTASPSDAGGIQGILTQNGNQQPYDLTVWARVDNSGKQWIVKTVNWDGPEHVEDALKGDDFAILGYYNGAQDQLIVATRN